MDQPIRQEVRSMQDFIAESRIRHRFSVGKAAGMAMMLAPFLVSVPAAAVEFQAGPITGSFDTTISSGTGFRAAERNKAFIGRANGGESFSTNTDDGNLNFDPGLTSLGARATHELSLKADNVGAFSRVSYFYDAVNARSGSTEFRDLSSDAVARVGRDFELLDAYVYGNFSMADRPTNLRLGNQVLSWGESTFIANGINAINPVNVGALRTPGSEVKNALVPVPMVSGSVGLTRKISVEGFYQFQWRETELDPSGTFFSTNDYVSPGGRYAYLGFGQRPDDPGQVNAPATAQVSPTAPGTTLPGATTTVGGGYVVPRGTDRTADDQGQYGLAVRYFAEELNDTEFGFYFINYHSRQPLLSARTGRSVNPTQENYVGTARYYTEYPENIKLFGTSFNTALPGGISFQGEVSYRKDQPLQLDDVEIYYASLSPTSAAINAGNNQIIRDLGRRPGLNEDLKGYRLFDVVQAQATLTRIFRPIESLGVDQWLLVGELGVTHVRDIPDRDKLLLEGAQTNLPGTTGSLRLARSNFGSSLPQQDGGYADATSWGYQIRARFDFLNAIGPVNLFPNIAFSHDFSGTTPSPLGNFIEGRGSVSVGLEAEGLTD
jgi:hypothetical protein